MKTKQQKKNFIKSNVSGSLILTDAFVRTLVEKLMEWVKDEYHAEIIIDTTIAMLKAEGWEEDDYLRLLEQTRDYFVDGTIRDRLIYEITAIKVNGGY